jgi:hypothetical protein
MFTRVIQLFSDYALIAIHIFISTLICQILPSIPLATAAHSRIIQLVNLLPSEADLTAVREWSLLFAALPPTGLFF